MHVFADFTWDMWLTFVGIFVYNGVYLYGMFAGKVRPLFSTRLFLSLGGILSFVTNFAETGMRGVLENMFNTLDVIFVLSIFCYVVYHQGFAFRKLDTFEKKLIGSTLVVAGCWFYLIVFDITFHTTLHIWGLTIAITQNIVAHALIQIIFFSGYLPLYKKLRSAHEHHESLLMRSLNAGTALMGMIMPIRQHALLPLLFTLRAALCTLLLCLILLRIDRKNSYGKKKQCCRTYYI